MNTQPHPKVPPHSIEAEQNVLGSLMLDNRRWSDVAAIVRPEHFYRQDHRELFEVMSKMLARGRATDFVTLVDALRKLGKLEEVGGVAYVGELANITWSHHNVVAYAELVRERAIWREFICVGSDIAELGYRPEDRPVAELLADAGARLLRVEQAARTAGAREVLSCAQALDEAQASLERAQVEASAGRTPGVPYSLPALDAATGGMRPGELIGLAARTSVGKTALAVQVAWQAARKGYRVLYLTLEESPGDVALRVVANAGSAHLGQMRAGRPDGVEAYQHARRDHRLGELPLWIDSRTFDLPGVIARILRFALQHQIQLAVVDHLLLVGVPGHRGKRYEQIGETTRTLKRTAEQAQIPILALAQLGRDADNPLRRPRLTDLRESGDIEQDLATCIALHPKGEVANGAQQVELGLLKNRYGPKGWLDSERFLFRGALQRFEQLAQDTDDYAEVRERELFGTAA